MVSKHFASALLIASILVSAVMAPPSFAVAAAAAKRPVAVPPPEPVKPLFGICDGTGVVEVLGDLSDPDANKKRNQIALLQGRILDCARDIVAARAAAPMPSPTPYWVTSGPLPTAAPAPAEACTNPPPATTDSNRLALYEILQRCAAYWTLVNGSASPAPSATAPPSIASRPTFYVFATGAVDPATATVLIRSVVARLALAQSRASAKAASDVVVTGRADWAATDFTSQCQLDPNTRGAIVIRTSLPETLRHNYLLLVANYTEVSATVDVLGCGRGDHDVAVAPLSLYSQEAISAKAHEDAVTLGIFSSIAAVLFTTKSKTTVTTGSGSTTITKSDSTAPALSGNVLGYFEGENLNLPAQNPSVELDIAGKRFAEVALRRLRSLCSRPEILRLAELGNPGAVPPPPVEHRTLLYKAAFEYVDDCALFADFQT